MCLCACLSLSLSLFKYTNLFMYNEEILIFLFVCFFSLFLAKVLIFDLCVYFDTAK